MAYVAPRPNDFHACARMSPTNTQSHGWIVTPAMVTVPKEGARNHNRNPSVDSSPNSVRAYREPIRSETAPPGYGYTALIRLPKVPNTPMTNALAPKTLRYSGRKRVVIWNPSEKPNIATDNTSTSPRSARNCR